MWAPRLIAVHGIGLIGAGIFTTDPGDGFPIGTPAGTPDTFTWHFYVHNAFSTAAFLAIAGACIVLARRVELGRTWRQISAATAAAFVLAFAWPDRDGITWRIALATAITFTWLAAVCDRLDPQRARPGA